MVLYVLACSCGYCCCVIVVLLIGGLMAKSKVSSASASRINALIAKQREELENKEKRLTELLASGEELQSAVDRFSEAFETVKQADGFKVAEIEELTGFPAAVLRIVTRAKSSSVSASAKSDGSEDSASAAGDAV